MATSDNPLVQYILLRRDLKKMKNYNDGAIIAQACHASNAILYKTINDELSKLYFNDLDRMHKIILGIDGGEKELNEFSHLLKENSIEQFFAKFKLYR
jgi:peptidyl-tRNA hydrolase